MNETCGFLPMENRSSGHRDPLWGLQLEEEVREQSGETPSARPEGKAP